MSGGNLIASSKKFEEEVAVASKTIFNLPFVLTVRSLVFLGSGLTDIVYTGLGTTILTFNNPIVQGQVVIVKE